jgi:transposase
VAGAGRLGEGPSHLAELAGRPGHHRPEPRQPGQHERPGEKGGDETGPNPTDRGKRGSKYHLLVDRRGIPLAVKLTAANVHDSKLLEPLVDAVPPIRRPTGQPGRPRFRPKKLHGDKAYDYPEKRRALRRRGITPRIARRGVESSERLGRHRWIVERTIAWLLAYRRLAVRCDRHSATVLALLHLTCSLICVRYLRPAAASERGGPGSSPASGTA